tara:strand:- start:1389 stop:2429 length:1041 start_codon:yes stop_codon:yes gene_type:complete
MVNHHIKYLIFSKVLIASSILFAFTFLLGWDMFKYPDFYSTYTKCSGKYYSNILYGELFCSLNSLTGIEFTHKSTIFILIAGLVNMLLLIGYFKIFQRYLNEYGKYFFIAILALHPYMGVYFFRFYTDLFASIGIFLMFYYIMNNKKMDIFFVVSGLILMNFRIALIPVFFIYSIVEIYRWFGNRGSISMPIILLIFSLISLFPVIDFGIKFSQINANIALFNKLIFNFIFTFGFRESFVGVFRQAFWGGDPLDQSSENPAIFIAEFQVLDFLSFLVSVMLLLIHIIGLYGILKFSIKEKSHILILFTYIILPLLSITHMRYLLPLMPVLLFGFSYIIFRNSSNGI